ncbi:MAG: hypothetical protein AAF403_08555, partial [Pseudomonadota bacterium]
SLRWRGCGLVSWRCRKYKNRGIYNHDLLLKIVDEHIQIVSQNKNQDNHMMFLWQMVNLNLWIDRVDELKQKYR